MHPLINIALRAGRDAAQALAHKVERLDRIEVIERDPLAFLTSVDQESDKTLLYHIQKAYPQHSIHSRVSGLHEGEPGAPVWLIDPLVGNLNFSKGYTRFGVAVAVRSKETVEHGIVICPMQNDEFSASRGNGAQLNSRRIRAGDDDIADSLLGMNAEGIDLQTFTDLQSVLLRSGAHPRLTGSSVLDLVDTACGRLQGGWCRKHDEASVAAANLILQEAGGYTGTESGDPRLESGEEQLFGTARVFRQLVKMRMRYGA